FRRVSTSTFAQLNDGRDALAAQSAQGEAGRTALERFSDQVDAAIRRLFDAGPRPSSAVAVFALGGYGRRQLCLHSDIDVLVLFGGPIGAADEQFLRALLHPLWDQGLDVSHQIRDLDDLARIDRHNLTFLPALADARPIVGARELGDRVADFLERS